jgi:hypothetical protein
MKIRGELHTSLLQKNSTGLVSLAVFDDPSSNTGLQHDSHRDLISITPLNHNTDPFSIEELDRLVHELRPNKAPGLDRLSGRVIKLTHPHTGQSLLNECVRAGILVTSRERGNMGI